MFGIVLVTLTVAVVATVLIVRVYIFPSEFEPVTLSAKEQQVLDDKLNRLGVIRWFRRREPGARTLLGGGRQP